MHRLFLSRSLALLVASGLAVSASAPALGALVQVARAYAANTSGDYTDAPGPVDPGANPMTDPTYRGGLWDDDSLASLRESARIEAGLDPAVAPAVDDYGAGDPGDDTALDGRPRYILSRPVISQTDSGGSTGGGGTTGGGGAPTPSPNPGPLPPGTLPGPGGGEGNNWEGTGPGGGSAGAPGLVNTQTGNRLTTLPVVGWKGGGGFAFGLTLFHNAQDNVDLGWGQNWRSTFDMRLIYTGNPVSTPSGRKDFITAIYPTGKRVPFTRPQGGNGWGAAFFPPVGYYEMVYALPDGTYVLRTPDQRVFAFDATGRLTGEHDRNGNGFYVGYANGRLASATDSAGRSLAFAWGTVNLGSGAQSNLTPAIVSVRSSGSRVAGGQPSGARTWSVHQDAGPYAGNDPANLKFLTGLGLPPSAALGSAGHGFAYDGAGGIVTEYALDGAIHLFGYDAQERLTSFSDPLNDLTTYAYNGGNTVRTNPDGGTQTDFYDSGALHAERDEAGFGRTYAYDGSYNVTGLTDERGDVQAFTYDAYGNRLTSQDPRQAAAGTSVSATYDATNDLLSSTDARGKTTVLGRDPERGSVLKVTDPTGSVVETNEWDVAGNLTKTVAGGVTTTAAYAGSIDLASVAGPNGTTNLFYDDPRFPGQATGWLDPQNRATGLEYDDWGRVDAVTRSDGATMSLTHDVTGRVTRAVDWLGHATTYAYDGAGRRVSKTDPLGHVERYGYDACGRVTTITDGRGKVRTYRYTLRGEVAGLTLPDGAVERYRYDAIGNQTLRTNARGESTTYAYDAADGLQSVAYPTGPGVAYAYDLDGRPTSMADGTGTSSWTYDDAGRVVGLATPQGTQGYGYDSDGHRAVVSRGSDGTIATGYADGRVASVVASGPGPLETTSYAYDATGASRPRPCPTGRSRPTATTRWTGWPRSRTPARGARRSRRSLTPTTRGAT